jgi:hypothetical protein
MDYNDLTPVEVHLQDILNVLFGLAALVAILDYFGIKPKQRADGVKMTLSRRWKLAIMLTLVAASLGLSGYSFYRSRHPKIIEKIIEKPVEKIVEKLVPQECPKCESAAITGKKKAAAPPPQTQSGQDNVQTGSITTAPCSNVQVGGSGNQATANCLPVARHLSQQQVSALGQLQIPPQVEMTLTTEADANSRTYAQEIFDACKGRISPNSFFTSLQWSSAPPTGVVVRVHDRENELIALAVQVANILRTPSVRVVSGVDAAAKPGKVEIIVGSPPTQP